jgi:hypothetical protein
MKIELQKIIFILIIIIFLLVIWDTQILVYWKTLSVLLHESFHALIGLILGGTDISISLSSLESGTTTINNLSNFAIPFVVSAGYIGTILVGGFLLRVGFQFFQAQVYTFIAGNWIMITGIFLLKPDNFFFRFTLSLGLIFIIISLLSRLYSSLLLIFLSITLLTYGIYDISDILFNPEITDAGILAKYLLGNGFLGGNFKNIAFNIGITWYILNIFIIIYFMKFLFFGDKTGDFRIDRMIEMVNNGNVPKDVANWFLEKGKDLDGNPIPLEKIDFMKRDKHE